MTATKSERNISPAKKSHILRRMPASIKEGYNSALLKLGRAMAGEDVTFDQGERKAVQLVEDVAAFEYSRRRIQGLTPVRQNGSRRRKV